MDFDSDISVLRNCPCSIICVANSQPGAMATIFPVSLLGNVKSAGPNIFLLAGGSSDTISVGSHPRNAQVFSNW